MFKYLLMLALFISGPLIAEEPKEVKKEESVREEKKLIVESLVLIGKYYITTQSTEADEKKWNEDLDKRIKDYLTNNPECDENRFMNEYVANFAFMRMYYKSINDVKKNDVLVVSRLLTRYVDKGLVLPEMVVNNINLESVQAALEIIKNKDLK